MAGTGEGRKAGDRRRIRANRVVDSTHTGKGNQMRGFARISRSAAFQSGAGFKGKNGRA